MKSRLLMIPAGAAFAALLAAVLPVLPEKETLPIRCSTFTRLDLGRTAGETKQYDMVLDLRLLLDGSGYLLLNGQVTSQNNKQDRLNRTLNLTQGKRVDASTYRYVIDKVKTSPADDLPATAFTTLFTELTGDPSVLQMDITELSKGVYLIAGPVSNLFVCVRY